MIDLLTKIDVNEQNRTLLRSLPVHCLEIYDTNRSPNAMNRTSAIILTEGWWWFDLWRSVNRHIHWEAII
jgi:hypothetical protein